MLLIIDYSLSISIECSLNLGVYLMLLVMDFSLSISIECSLYFGVYLMLLLIDYSFSISIECSLYIFDYCFYSSFYDCLRLLSWIFNSWFYLFSLSYLSGDEWILVDYWLFSFYFYNTYSEILLVPLTVLTYSFFLATS